MEYKLTSNKFEQATSSNNAFRVTNNQTKKPSSLIVETGSVHEQFANISLSSEDTSSLFYRQNPKTPSQLSLRDCRIIRGASKFRRQSRRKKQSRSLKISVVLFLQILPLIQVLFPWKIVAHTSLELRTTST